MTDTQGPAPTDDGRDPSTGTSQSLLERARTDEAEAWDRLVALYAPVVYRWCRRWDLPEQEVADVFQDVFGAVAAHLGEFRRDRPGDTFRGWLRTITQNKVRDHYRRLGREPAAAGGTEANLRFDRLPDTHANDNSDDQIDGGLVASVLESVRAEFEDRTWRAFWLTAVEDRTPGEVAPELGMTPGAVRVAKSRVLRRLREELGE
jgi:RNA polymerase sigma-70 factor (ECF subfamily)